MEVAQVTLQHTATHCNTLQHTATHCNTLQHTAMHCNALQHTATHCKLELCPCIKVCNTLRRTATHCNTLQHTAMHCNTLQHCNTMKHAETHCNTLQQHNSKIKKGSWRDVTWKDLVGTWRLICYWSYLLTFCPPLPVLSLSHRLLCLSRSLKFSRSCVCTQSLVVDRQLMRIVAQTRWRCVVVWVTVRYSVGQCSAVVERRHLMRVYVCFISYICICIWCMHIHTYVCIYICIYIYIYRPYTLNTKSESKP